MLSMQQHELDPDVTSQGDRAKVVFVSSILSFFFKKDFAPFETDLGYIL